jgi:iron-sulfur cluster assembly accessory protein
MPVTEATREATIETTETTTDLMPEVMTNEPASPITLTDRAAQEVGDILEQQGNPGDIALRVYVSGGGCSGLQYGLALVEESEFEEGDEFFFDRDVKIVIDPMSLRYIKGSIVDYVNTPMGGGFKVENPNAARSCGCGSSFTTDDYDGPTVTSGCGSCGSK